MRGAAVRKCKDAREADRKRKAFAWDDLQVRLFASTFIGG